MALRAAKRATAHEAAEPRRKIRSYARTAYTEAILEAAERLFLRVGYHDAKMADLATEAQVAVGTLYRYFSSKEEVFASLVARGREEVLAILAACLALPATRPRLEAVVGRLFEYVEERGALFAIYAQLGTGLEAEGRDSTGMEQGCERFLGALAALFREGIESGEIRKGLDPECVAAAFSGTLHAALFAWMRADRTYSLRARAAPFLELFLEGALAR
jgi:AcrR family transcriptional regulator